MANTIQIDVVANDAASGVLNGLTSRMGALGDVIQAVASGNIAGAMSSAIGLIIDQTKKAISSTVEYSGQIKDLSGTMGTSAEQSSSLIQVSKALGISYNELTTAVNNAIKKGFVPSVESLKDMAVEYQKLPSIIDKSEYATERFGASASVMQKILESTPDSIDAIVSSADGLNQIWGDEQIKNVEEYSANVYLLNEQFSALSIKVGSEVIPTLTRLIELLNGAQTISLNPLDWQKSIEEASKAYGEIARGINYLNNAPDFGGAIADATKENQGLLALAKQITSANRSYADSMDELNEQRDKELITLGELEAGYWSYQDAGRAVWNDLQGVERQLKTYRPALDSTGESLKGLLERQQELRSELEDYDQVWGQDIKGIKDTKEALGEVEAKIKEVEEAHELATRQIVLNLLTQELAMDGLTAAETDQLLNLGVQWGIYDETIRAEMATAREEVAGFQRDIGSLPEGKSFTYTLYGNIDKSFRDAMDAAGFASPIQKPSESVKGNTDAWGGWESANTPHLVGERGPELWVPGTSGKVIPNNQLGGGGGVEIDYDRLTRSIIEGMVQSGYVR